MGGTERAGASGAAAQTRLSSTFWGMARSARYEATSDWSVSQLGTQPMRPDSAESGTTA